MRLFNTKPGSAEEAARAAESAKRIAAGQLPLSAVERLEGLEGKAFTSNLSPNELLLTLQCGYKPVGQVMGCSVYAAGLQFMSGSYFGSGELEVLTEANMDCWRLAMGRLRQEAEKLGCAGVVGVRTSQRRGVESFGMLEVKAIGTGVKRIDGSKAAEPFISSLSGQDHWTLVQAGYKPVGVVFGACSYYQVGNFRIRFDHVSQATGLFTGNGEMVDYSRAIAAAREAASMRMTYAASQLGAQGVLGLDLDLSFEMPDQSGQECLLIQASALGTAVERMGAAASSKPELLLEIGPEPG